MGLELRVLGRYESSLVMRQLITSGEKVQCTSVQPLLTTLGFVGLVGPASPGVLPAAVHAQIPIIVKLFKVTCNQRDGRRRGFGSLRRTSLTLLPAFHREVAVRKHTISPRPRSATKVNPKWCNDRLVKPHVSPGRCEGSTTNKHAKHRLPH